MNNESNNTPLISICIANYNGRDILERCISSIHKQTTNIPYEIIIHDDASTDNSVKIIEQHPEIRIIKSQNNVGYCISNNRMVQKARGKYLLLLNNDAALFDDAVECLSSHVENTLHDDILTIPQYDMDSKQLLDCGAKLDFFCNAVHIREIKEQEVAVVAASCLWISRELWNTTGGFPEHFGSMAEDTYLCCYARLMGYKVVALSQSGYLHDVGKSFGGGRVTNNKLSSTYKRRSMSELNKTKVMILTYPSVLVWPILVLHVISLAIEGLVFSLVKLDMKPAKIIYLNCITSILRQLPELLSMRKKLQLSRNVSVKKFYQAFSFTPHKLKLLLRHGFPNIN